MWATEHETREEIIDRYRRVWEHSDATITALAIDAPGHVPWWPRPDVKLFNILVHVLTETNRHAGHADILREQLDGSTGTTAEYATAATRPSGKTGARRSSGPPKRPGDNAGSRSADAGAAATSTAPNVIAIAAASLPPRRVTRRGRSSLSFAESCR